MMGTLAGVLARKQINTAQEEYWADVEGDIEDINGVLRIARIRVNYHLRVSAGKEADARQALGVYLARCPAAQSVIGCIEIIHSMEIEQLAMD
jgi:uncharacterized OsmC-like protein